MQLITPAIQLKIENGITERIRLSDYHLASAAIAETISTLYEAIPQNKRISYGIAHTVKELGNYLFISFEEKKLLVFESFGAVFNLAEQWESRAVALCVFSHYGFEFPNEVLPFFEKAADDDDWEMREISQMLFRKLIKKHPDIMQQFLLKLVISDNAKLRRFVGETMRPVCENKWFYKQPEYALTVIRHLFKESKPFPRTSAGNNLSDLARHQPELVYSIVEELVASGNKHSYWIAYRACRNLVKKEPDRVMKLLGIDAYKYKDQVIKKQ